MNAFRPDRRRWSDVACLSLFVLLATFAAVAFADDVKTKLPVPDEASQKTSQKAIDGLYGKQIRAAKGREEKATLAKMLLKVANDEKDDAGRYVLLDKSKSVASDASDVETAFGAIAELDRLYAIDVVTAHQETLKAAAKNAATPAARSALLDAGQPIIDEAIAVGRFTSAKQIGDLLIIQAKKDNDTLLVKELQKRLTDLTPVEQVYNAGAAAMATLKSSPNDPAANLAAGKYRCFVKGEWEAGLPMLALGNDAELKELAATEIAGPATVDQKIALADSWWDCSKKQKAALKSGPMQHAGAIYQRMLADLNGLPKIKVEKRLAEVAASLPGRTIDLLKIVDPARDAQSSAWHVQDGALSNDPAASAELRFGYRPPAEYDYTLEYTRDDGRWGAAIIYCRLDGVGTCQMPTTWGSSVAIDPPAGQSGKDLNALVRAPANGVYKVRLQVRNRGLVIYVNGDKLIDHRMDDWAISKRPDWLKPAPVEPGFIVFYGKVTVTRAEIKEISGQGTLLH